MLVFRIARVAHAALDGEGARLAGGRWNSAGRPVVYTGTSRAVAMLEVLAHADPDLLPPDLAMFRIEVPDELSSERVDRASLAADWRTPGCLDCVTKGDTWLRRGAHPLLFVPSAIVPEEWNLLINPQHAAAARVVVTLAERFSFDSRLL